MNIDNDEQSGYEDLRRVANRIRDAYTLTEAEGVLRDCVAAQRQALRDEVMGAIGEDEVEPATPYGAVVVQKRNALREKQRTAISTIFEGKK